MDRYSITLVTFLLFLTVQVKAQFMPGNVVVHSDPRLAVLLKKNPTALPPITPISNPDGSSGKVHRKTPKDDIKPVKKNQPQATAMHEAPVVAAVTPSHELAAGLPKKTNNAPVHQFVAPSRHKESRVIYAGKGFRVQIYYGSDREKAIKVKSEFMRLNPGISTYLSYLSPSFRVKVGDYRNRNEALGMLKEANSMYSPCMIVPDEVTVHAN